MLIEYLTIIVDIQACNNIIHDNNTIIMQRNKLIHVHIILTNNWFFRKFHNKYFCNLSLLEETREYTGPLFCLFICACVYKRGKELISKCALAKVRGQVVGLGSLLLPDWVLGLELRSSHLVPGVFTESSNETSVYTSYKYVKLGWAWWCNSGEAEAWVQGHPGL